MRRVSDKLSLISRQSFATMSMGDHGRTLAKVLRLIIGGE